MVAHELATQVALGFHAPDRIEPYAPLRPEGQKAAKGNAALGEAVLRGFLMRKVLEAGGGA